MSRKGFVTLVQDIYARHDWNGSDVRTLVARHEFARDEGHFLEALALYRDEELHAAHQIATDLLGSADALVVTLAEGLSMIIAEILETPQSLTESHIEAALTLTEGIESVRTDVLKARSYLLDACVSGETKLPQSLIAVLLSAYVRATLAAMAVEYDLPLYERALRGCILLLSRGVSPYPAPIRADLVSLLRAAEEETCDSELQTFVRLVLS